LFETTIKVICEGEPLLSTLLGEWLIIAFFRAAASP
jgi:hypothetical protein